MLKKNFLLISFSFLISLVTFSQQSRYAKMDSLINLKQPVAAQKELWSIIEKAQKTQDNLTLIEGISYFNQLVYPMEMEERASLYFKVLKKIENFPEPAKSLSQLAWINEIAYNRYLWFGYGQLKTYDSLDFNAPEVRFNFLLGNIEKLENKLDDFKSTPIKTYEKVLFDESNTDSLPFYHSISDYIAYQLIELYQSPMILNDGTLKNESYIQSEWYGTTDKFIKLQFDKDNLTNRTLKLYQKIEENNQNNLNTLSLAVYQRLQYLKENDENKEKVNLIWQQHFEYFKKSSARSKFLFEMAKIKYEKGKTYHFKIHPEVELLIKEVHTELTAEIKKFPKSDFSSDINSFLKIIEHKEISVSFPNINTPNKKIPLQIKHQNYGNHFLRIYKINDYDPLNVQTLKKYVEDNQLSLVRSLEIELKNKNLFQTRTTELLLDKITESGNYFIIATETLSDLSKVATSDSIWNATKIVSSQLVISEISATTSTANNQFLTLVVDQNTGNPVKDATVSLYMRDYTVRGSYPKLLKSGKTNSDGIFVGSLNNDKRIYYVVEYKNSVLSGENYNYEIGEPDSYSQVKLLTDRAIYRPGQTVYFKGITYEGKKNDFKTLQNKKIVVTLRDASYQEIYKETFTSNTFGSIDGSIQLPHSLPLGNFTLMAIAVKGSPQNNYSQTMFSVEEYKRPTFEVELFQPKEEAKLDDTVHVMGNAKAFAGFPIANAEVSYTVYRNWFRYWRYFNVPNSGDLLEEGTLKTDQNGDFTVDFFAATDPNANKFAYYYFEVKVKITDISGETHEKTLTLNLSKVGLSIQAETPQRIFSHDKEFAKVNVVNLAGEKQKGFSGEVRIYQNISNEQFLNRIWSNAETTQFDEKEFSQLFPNMKWDEFKDDSDKTKLIKTISFKSGDSLDINDLLNKNQGSYTFKFNVITTKGDTLKTEQNIWVIDVKSKDLPSSESLWSYVSSDEVKVGKSIDFQVGSSFKNAKALVSVFSKTKLISQEWIDLNERYSLCYPVREEDRGAITFEVLLFHNGVFYSKSENVIVPFSNKQLEIKTLTFRDKLQPGQKEQWSFQIKDENNNFSKSELAAAMYDASLDKIRNFNWSFWPYNNYYYQGNMSWRDQWSRTIYSMQSPGIDWELQSALEGNTRLKNSMRLFRYDIYRDFNFRGGMDKKTQMQVMVSTGFANTKQTEDNLEQNGNRTLEEVTSTLQNGQNETAEVTLRSNFNETAFFYPTIYANPNDEYVLNFTLPESLTKWKLLLLAHNEKLQVGTLQKEITAQKELMITANAPRFVRQDDRIDFSAKVINMTENEQTVEVTIKLENPISSDVLNLIKQPLSQTVTIPANSSKEVSWTMNIANQELIQYTITASNESFSDGERNVLPVLSNRTLVTETERFLIREAGADKYTFGAFKNHKSNTLENKSYSMEYIDNLAWEAVMALPYLSKKNDQSVTALINSYYANAIAQHIVNNNPQIKAIFEQWKMISPEVFNSELEKNETLKNILLEETPWVTDAKNEAEQRRRIGQLFELNQLTDNQQGILNELKKRQNQDGGFSWFSGGRSNAYITQAVILRFGYLKRLGIATSNEMQIISKAEQFAANYQIEFYTKYLKTEKAKKNYSPSSLDINWLFSRTFFDGAKSKEIDEIIALYKEKLIVNWHQYRPYEQALIGLYFKKENLNENAKIIYSSLLDRAKKNTDIGMYWVENSGYYWYENKIATQALIITFFQEMNTPEKIMDDARLWLILNKETNAWETGTESAEAIYATLNSGRDYLSNSQQPKIKVGSKELIYETNPSESQSGKVSWTPGIGQVKSKWTGTEITPDLGDISIEKYSTAPGVLNLYWQYTEDLANIKSSKNQSMQIKKKYNRITAGEKGEKGTIDSVFAIGDKIEVVLIVTVDRDLEFVHIKDLRPAGFEPAMASSSWNWESQLFYYQSPKDVSMDYFVENMPKGTYKFTYVVYATHSGSFNSGLSEIQCFYAPVFTAHSDTQEVEIKR